MKLSLAGVGRLLDPAPMPLEMGWERLDDGVLHVAIRTDMRGCTGAMFDWWFGSRLDTRDYIWWHPLDHVSSSWEGGTEGSAVGAIHVVEERSTTRPAQNLLIQFRDPAELFGADPLAAAKASGAVSTALVARGTARHLDRRDDDGRVIGTRLVHLGRDTDWGMVLRTHFFLGADLPAMGVPADRLVDIFPDAQAPDLLQHCYDEFSFLARFLPARHVAENRATIPVVRPW